MKYLPFVTSKIDSETFNMEVKKCSYGEQIGVATVLIKNEEVVYIDYSIPDSSRFMELKIIGEIPQNEIIKTCKDMLSQIY